MDSASFPREISRDFVTLLDLLYQNPAASFDEVMRRTVEASSSGADDEAEDALGALDAPQAPVTPPPAVTLDDLEL